MSDETNVLLSHHDVLVCEIDNLRSDLDAVTTRAEKAEAELARIRDDLTVERAFHERDKQLLDAEKEFSEWLNDECRMLKTRAEKAEAQHAAVNDTLRACWGEDLGTLLVRVTTAEAEVVRLAGLLATKLGLDDVG